MEHKIKKNIFWIVLFYLTLALFNPHFDTRNLKTKNIFENTINSFGKATALTGATSVAVILAAGIAGFGISEFIKPENPKDKSHPDDSLLIDELYQLNSTFEHYTKLQKEYLGLYTEHSQRQIAQINIAVGSSSEVRSESPDLARSLINSGIKEFENKQIELFSKWLQQIRTNRDHDPNLILSTCYKEKSSSKTVRVSSKTFKGDTLILALTQTKGALREMSLTKNGSFSFIAKAIQRQKEIGKPVFLSNYDHVRGSFCLNSNCSNNELKESEFNMQIQLLLSAHNLNEIKLDFYNSEIERWKAIAGNLKDQRNHTQNEIGILDKKIELNQTELEVENNKEYGCTLLKPEADAKKLDEIINSTLNKLWGIVLAKNNNETGNKLHSLISNKNQIEVVANAEFILERMDEVIAQKNKPWYERLSAAAKIQSAFEQALALTLKDYNYQIAALENLVNHQRMNLLNNLKNEVLCKNEIKTKLYVISKNKDTLTSSKLKLKTQILNIDSKLEEINTIIDSAKSYTDFIQTLNNQSISASSILKTQNKENFIDRFNALNSDLKKVLSCTTNKSSLDKTISEINPIKFCQELELNIHWISDLKLNLIILNKLYLTAQMVGQCCEEPLCRGYYSDILKEPRVKNSNN
ncbi:MAG: hypothetical protein K1X29_03425 [Bdellovibrionales bacterium]|nr:hypothetical protein [Bdellovibrionales bacterium]